LNSSPSSDDLQQLGIWQTKDKQQNDCFLVYIPDNVTWEYEPVSKSYIQNVNQFARGLSDLYLTEDIGTVQPIPLAPSAIDNPSVIVTDFDDFCLF